MASALSITTITRWMLSTENSDVSSSIWIPVPYLPELTFNYVLQISTTP